MPDINPFTILDRNQNELKEQYKHRERTLRSYNLPQKTHNNIVAQMQQGWDESKFKFTSTRRQLDDIKRDMAFGRIDHLSGQKAMMQLVVPQERGEAMFRKPERQLAIRRGRFSPQQLETFGEIFVEVNKNAIVDPWGFFRKSKRKYADPEKLKENYFMLREGDGYDVMDTEQQKQYDRRYDMSVNKDPRMRKVWAQMVGRGKNSDPDIRMARTYGARLLNIAAGKTRGQSISPFAGAFQKPKTQPPVNDPLGIR